MVGRWFFMIIGTIFSITPAFVYWLAGWLTIQNDPTAPTIGDIVAFTTLQCRLFFPMGQLLNVQVEIQGALALFDRIFEYLEMDPEIVDAPDAVDLAPTPSAARSGFRDVSFRYPTQAVPSDAPPRRRDAGRRARGGGSRGGARLAVDTEAVETLVDGEARSGGMPALEMLPPFGLERHRLRGASPASSSRWLDRPARARRRPPT